MNGTLYLVSASVGDVDDITIRGRRTISEVDTVVCAERRAGSTLLSSLSIDKPLIELNEENEAEVVPKLIVRLKQGASLALISDHGMPFAANPGSTLVSCAIDSGIPVTPIPGGSSVIAGLVSSGLPAYRFRFIALPGKSEERRRTLRGMRDLAETLVVIDGPSRLTRVLMSIRQELGDSRQIAVGCNLTMEDEHIVRGTVAQVAKDFEKQRFAGDFVVVIEGIKRKKSSKRS